MPAIDPDKFVDWLRRQIALLSGGADWDAEDFLAGQYAAFVQIEDMVTENAFAPISGVDND